MKKLLLLGGSRYLVPVIEAAHEMGIYVITCDYLPDNIAHRYSDEYCNISIIDKDAVLKQAQKLKIDGIMSFACDPGVVVAAYVAEQMRLPFQGSYESVSILQNKGKFRKFLIDNGFNCPYARSYTDKKNALKELDKFRWPIMVKPVDSAGSKGVIKVEHKEDISKAIENALKESRSGEFIIEEFLTFQGYHSSTDVFTVNGKLEYCTYSDQLFDSKADNPYTPAFIIWPSSMAYEHQAYLTQEIKRLMNLLHMKSGIYNIETCVDIEGKPYIMEVSPRGGGCKIAEIQYLATGTNLIEAEIKQAMGENVDNIFKQNIDGVWCEMVLHNEYGKSGNFNGIEIDKNIREKYVKIIDLGVKEGDFVEPFTGANKSLGDIFLKFESRKELNRVMEECDSWLKVHLSPV